MKKNAKRFAALALVLALAVGALGQTAFASQALGSEVSSQTTQLANGVSLTSQTLWSASKNDYRRENYITYAPGGGVTPMVYSGTYVTSLNTVASAASALEARGYRVVAGVNGGFFNSDGTAVGVLMTEGVVRSLDVYNYALLGFTWGGQVFIDEGGWTMTRTVSWETADGPSQYHLAGFNAHRSNDDLGGLYLYNRDFSSRVNYDTSRGCVAVVLTPVSGGGVTMNGTLTLSVERTMDTRAGDVFNGALTDGRYMLYANYYSGNDALLSGLRSLTPGQQVTVTVGGVSSQWADAAYGITGLYTLLRGGQVVSGLPTAANPYTAVGLKADGTAVFYTIDGRQSGYSVGATYTQVAQRLRELGCVTAVALDGGGSTTLGATLPGRQKFELLNQPSQTGRALNNSIFLVTAPVNYPFADIANHWSADYVSRLYELGITQGIVQSDGTVVFQPDAKLTRGELLVFITRLLGVDTGLYQNTVLPFADVDTIPEWMLPSVKAMYALGVLNGSGNGENLYANVDNRVSREEAMTMLGRILTARVGRDLSDFSDSGSVSDWARPYVETLVGLNVVQGSGGKLNPQSDITRGEAAKLLVEINGMEKAALTPRTD